MLQRGCECLAPAVSRTFHFGTSGVHIKNIMVQAQFSGHLTTGVSGVKLHGLER